MHNDSGECTLGILNQTGKFYDNLKMPLIEGDYSIEVRARAVAYLALVLRYARTWLLETHSLTYQGIELEWFVNIGLPTDSFEDENLSRIYHAVVRSAWRISILPDAITLPLAVKCLNSDKHPLSNTTIGNSNLQLAEDRFNAFPEFAPQIAGYVRSPMRQNGLHVNVDVGGGTLDVTVFNVYQNDGEDVFPIFARKVESLGVRYLVKARFRAIDNGNNEQISPFDDLLSDADFIEYFGIRHSVLESVDEEFRVRVKTTIGEAICYTSQNRYPHAPQWHVPSPSYGKPVPTFFCGGGANLSFYAKLLSEYEDNDPPYKLRSTQLPVPNDLSFPDSVDNHYSRLSVAYGLSFDPFDIGRIKKMCEIDDNLLTPPEIKFPKDYPGKEVT